MMIVETVDSYLNNPKGVTGGVIKQRDSDPGCQLRAHTLSFFPLTFMQILSLFPPHLSHFQSPALALPAVCQKP